MTPPQKCWPWLWCHSWSKWTAISAGKTSALVDGLGLPIHEKEARPIIGAFEIQRRECAVCGKSQLRQTETR